MKAEVRQRKKTAVNPAFNQQHQQAPKVRIPSPGDPSAYFAPISPAAPVHSSSNSADLAANTSESSSNPLMEMLKGRAGDAPPSSGGSWGDNNPEALASRLPGKVMSVEELEAQQQQQVCSQTHYFLFSGYFLFITIELPGGKINYPS